jgi:hypothetical protein
LYKIAFDLPEDVAAWAPAGVERLWARKTAVQFEVAIENIPFYVKGISCGDIVRVRPDHDRRELVFERLVSRSGSSTVRLIVKDESVVDDVESLLRQRGLAWEIDGTGYLWAVDVPRDVEYAPVRTALVEMMSQGYLDIEEAVLVGAHRDVLA